MTFRLLRGTAVAHTQKLKKSTTFAAFYQTF